MALSCHIVSLLRLHIAIAKVLVFAFSHFADCLIGSTGQRRAPRFQSRAQDNMAFATESGPSANDRRVKISIKNAAATAAFNTMQNDTLDKLLEMGGINIIQYLQNLNAPFADKLLASVQEQQAQLEQMYQQQQAMAMQQGGGQVENGIVQGADQNAVAQAQSALGYNRAA